MDSLQALMFIRNLKRVFNLPQLAVNDIYSNPSLLSLARILQHFLKQEEDVSMPLLAKETALIDPIPPLEYSPVPSPTINGGSIVLTGSTGGLGSYILQRLLTATTTTHIYYLLTEFPKDRVTFLSADLSKSKLGLGDEIYTFLLQNITQIIHNALPLKFHINQASYHPHLLGVVNLVKFASEASRSPSFLYVSSVSAVSNFTSVGEPISRIPQAIIH
ncbi:uncharacterized protein EAF01_000622 [Botrytis porri]|uniref:uncharacterized protein n=1 Tax=Botrytis porri TaxID=87229 RepID=UPI0019021A81|nr:uncharacterized protein EAF01_000622 [Botrytis porri]KAF7914216.1 hypothetical protein EAF01_000622 [Botrytis porri]